MSNVVNWLNHQFSVFTPDTTWNPVAGIYIFTGVSPQNTWVALYIGQTNSFSERLPKHERWADAQRRGATHIHAMVVPLQANRDSIETQLIQACQPPLNTQLK